MAQPHDQIRISLPKPFLLAVLAGVALLVWLASDIIFVVFAAILLALAFDGLAAGLQRLTGLPRRFAVPIVIVTFVGMLVGAGVGMAPAIADNLEQLRQLLVDAVAWATDLLSRYPWAENLVSAGDDGSNGQVAQEAVNRVLSTMLMAGGTVFDLVLVLVISAYLAIHPSIYVNGLLRLVPMRRRPRLTQVLHELAFTLRWWLLGQLVSMTVLGVLTSIGLALLNVPLWYLLALLTAVFTFVPFLGPIFAAVPVLLVAFSQGVTTGVSVLALYAAVQNIEGYWLTPMVQQHAVRMPPSLLIVMQVLLGVLFGAWGLVLAAPLTAGGMVAVQMLYVEDMLRDPSIRNSRRHPAQDPGQEETG